MLTEKRIIKSHNESTKCTDHNMVLHSDSRPCYNKCSKCGFITLTTKEQDINIDKAKLSVTSIIGSIKRS